MKYSQGVCGARMGFSMRRHVIFFGVLLLFVLQMGPSILDTEAARGIGGVRVTDRQGNSFELYKDYYALVVGVSDYAHWPKLRNAANDARQVASGLKELGFEVKLVLDPSYAEMRSALRDLAYTMGIEQQRGLLFYFAGHGETLELADGTQLGFIIPRDCPLKSNDALGFDSKAISMNEIESTALKVKSKHLLMVFDSCFSGSLFYVDRSPPADITEKSARPVRQFITAGEAEEQVPDQSVFKVVFLQGIKGEADLNADGYVTGSELGMHLETMVVRYSKGDQHPKYGKINNPKLDKGDFVFVPAAKTAALPAPVPQPPVVMPVPSPAPQPPPISPAAIPTIAGKWDRYLSPEAVAGSFPPALPTDSTGFAKTTELEVVQTGETFRVLSAYHLTLRRTDTLDPPWEGKIHAAGVTLTAEDRQRGTTKTDQGVITQMNPGNSIARIDWGKSKSYWIRSGTFAEQTAAVPPQTEPPKPADPLEKREAEKTAIAWLDAFYSQDTHGLVSSAAMPFRFMNHVFSSTHELTAYLNEQWAKDPGSFGQGRSARSENKKIETWAVAEFLNSREIDLDSEIKLRIVTLANAQKDDFIVLLTSARSSDSKPNGAVFLKKNSAWPQSLRGCWRLSSCFNLNHGLNRSGRKEALA
jgi:hypothetical protein